MTTNKQESLTESVFGYPEYNEQGEMLLTDYTGPYRAMNMDIRLHLLEVGERLELISQDEETAVLLLRGDCRFEAEGISEEVSRSSVFLEGPYCLHVCCGEPVCVEAKTQTELLVQKTKNERRFETRLYRPADAPLKDVCKEDYLKTAYRRVNTIFDHDIQPASNMVLGEVLNEPGNWSAYLPHRHPQPECYFFLFDHPEGFGASFIDDKVYKSVDHSFSAIPGGCLHPQVSAPGYQMYTCWMIRHIEGNPWLQTDRCEDDTFTWLHDARYNAASHSFGA